MKPEQLQELATCIQTMSGILDIGTKDLVYTILEEDFITTADGYALLQPRHSKPPEIPAPDDFPYFPGMDCQCAASSESECGCPGVDWTPTEVKKLREATTYNYGGCTASAMGWAIKYANLHELALRLIQAKGRFHTQKAFENLSEFVSSANTSVHPPL